MTQIIRCSFPVYVDAPNPNWLQKLGKFLAEQFSWPGYRQEKSFMIRTEHPGLFLNSKFVFSADATLLDRPQPGKFEVIRWEIGVGGDNIPLIELELRELKPSPFQVWFTNLSDGRKALVAVGAIVLPLFVILMAVDLIASYPSPIRFWAWFARSLQGIATAGFILLIWIPYVRLRARYENAPFNKEVLLWLCVGLTAFAWLAVAILFSADAPLDSPDEAIRYLDGLKSNATTSVPLLISLIPWGVIAVKWLGWDLLSSLLSAVKDGRSGSARGGAA